MVAPQAVDAEQNEIGFLLRHIELSLDFDAVESSTMSAQAYRELILKGILELPVEALAEVADFVYFLRHRVATPQNSLDVELNALSQEETLHLEQEFLDYERLYPVE
jgi:hypothetical protein